MNKQLSVMGLAARASMVPVLIAAGLTALAVGALTYLAHPEHTGGAAGVGAAPLAAAVGYLIVMVMLWLYFCMWLLFMGAEINCYLEQPEKFSKDAIEKGL